MRHSFFALLVSFLTIAAADAADWNRFRGPDGSGRVDGPALPSSWSSDENLKWRSALPGHGVSSPIVVGDRVYLTAYTGYGLDAEEPGEIGALVRHLLAFDRASGKELWRASVPSTGNEDPYRGFITQHGYASTTPVSDGKHVFALFGKSGLYAYDSDGKELWKRDVGQKSDPARWGDGSSPILVGDVLVVHAGVLDHRVIGLDKTSGRELWSIEDAGFTSAWSTPTTVRVDGKEQLLVHVPKKIMGIDPSSGTVLWSAESPLDDATAPSIVTHGTTALLMGSRAGHAMAVGIEGRGDVTESHTRWNHNMRAGITTPIVVGDQLFWPSNGIFISAAIESGEVVYKERLPKHGSATTFPNVDYASPVAIGNRIIQFTRNGESYVIEAGETFELVSHNPGFDDDATAFSATPAISDGELFVRSGGYLYCISAK